MKKIAILGLLIAMAGILFHGYAFAGKSQTIIGTVTDNYEIATSDGTVYEITGNKKGDEVAMLIGARVKVTGVVKEHIDMSKDISITSYEILESYDEKYEEDGTHDADSKYKVE